MKRCFIFSAGTAFRLYERPQADDFVIAADAGYLTAKTLGVTPNLILGDFDSAPKPDAFCEVSPVEKDDTDTMLAVKKGLSLGCTEFFFYGATGGRRLDHTLANLQTLAFLKTQGAKGFLYDDGFVYTAICNETLTLKRTVPWGLVSVFCMSDSATVSNTGLQYPLQNAKLSYDFPLGVSNHFTEDTATVTAKDGMLLVGWELSK